MFVVAVGKEAFRKVGWFNWVRKLRGGEEIKRSELNDRLTGEKRELFSCVCQMANKKRKRKYMKVEEEIEMVWCVGLCHVMVRWSFGPGIALMSVQLNPPISHVLPRPGQPFTTQSSPYPNIYIYLRPTAPTPTPSPISFFINLAQLALISFFKFINYIFLIFILPPQYIKYILMRLYIN